MSNEPRADVETGSSDTVIVACTDMHGRFTGKRPCGEIFPEQPDSGRERTSERG